MIIEQGIVTGIILEDRSMFILSPYSKSGVHMSYDSVMKLYREYDKKQDEEDNYITPFESDMLNLVNIAMHEPKDNRSTMEQLQECYRGATFFRNKRGTLLLTKDGHFFYVPSSQQSLVDVHRAYELQERLNNQFS